MASKTTFLQDVEARRTFYAIANESTIADSRIEEIVKHAVLHVPSAFNTQSARAVVLLGKQHEKLWDIAYEAAKATAPPEVFKNLFEPRIAGFRKGYGTVSLFPFDVQSFDFLKLRCARRSQVNEDSWTDVRDSFCRSSSTRILSLSEPWKASGP